MDDFNRQFRALIESDPSLRALFPRDPRYRYFEDKAGRCFLWTTERMGDGKYASAILMPTGKGARSGRKAVTGWKTVREVHHTTRTAAKARALKLYHQFNDEVKG